MSGIVGSGVVAESGVVVVVSSRTGSTSSVAESGVASAADESVLGSTAVLIRVVGVGVDFAAALSAVASAVVLAI
jgi:hypothetical protein